MCLIWSEGIRTVRSNPRAVCLLDDSRRGVSRKASSPSTSLVTSGNDLVLFTRNAPTVSTTAGGPCPLRNRRRQQIPAQSMSFEANG